MTAQPDLADRFQVIAGGRGRPPESRYHQMADLISDLRDELNASTAERIAFAADVLAVARRSQVALASGWSPAQMLDWLERAAIRDGTRARSARVDDDGGDTA